MSTLLPATITWAMPNRWTFQIPPIAEWIQARLSDERSAVIVDPFAGQSTIATHRNDLGMGGEDAQSYCESLLVEGITADVVLWDPPYSPRQMAECYRSIGLKPTMKDTQNAALYARVRPALASLLRPGGLALCFGWTTNGFGKDWAIEDLLIVQHGGGHNDTLCTAQRKPLLPTS